MSKLKNSLNFLPLSIRYLPTKLLYYPSCLFFQNVRYTLTHLPSCSASSISGSYDFLHVHCFNNHAVTSFIPPVKIICVSHIWAYVISHHYQIFMWWSIYKNFAVIVILTRPQVPTARAAIVLLTRNQVPTARGHCNVNTAPSACCAHSHRTINAGPSAYCACSHRSINAESSAYCNRCRVAVDKHNLYSQCFDI
jgi:hypothetical protein